MIIISILTKQISLAWLYFVPDGNEICQDQDWSSLKCGSLKTLVLAGKAYGFPAVYCYEVNMKMIVNPINLNVLFHMFIDSKTNSCKTKMLEKNVKMIFITIAVDMGLAYCLSDILNVF